MTSNSPRSSSKVTSKAQGPSQRTVPLMVEDIIATAISVAVSTRTNPGWAYCVFSIPQRLGCRLRFRHRVQNLRVSLTRRRLFVSCQSFRSLLPLKLHAPFALTVLHRIVRSLLRWAYTLTRAMPSRRTPMPDDDDDRAARMEDEGLGTGNVRQRHDLRAHRENQFGRVTHSVSHSRGLPVFANFGSARSYTRSKGVMSLPFFHSWTFALCSATNALMSMI
jgi:hypothetical protein